MSQNDVSLNSVEVHCVAYSIHSFNSEGAIHSKTPYAHETDKTRMLDLSIVNPACNQGGVCVVVIRTWIYDARGNGDGNTSPTITGDHQNRITDYTAIVLDDNVKTIVRRLTPLECERLQGFPDGWTDIGEWTDTNGKKHKEADSPRYKALGNSICVPFWFQLLRKISAQYERPATLGSLFDGIGGFPYAWEKCNGRGTAIWASEIEEFPIAVTKRRFPEEIEADEHSNSQQESDSNKHQTVNG